MPLSTAHLPASQNSAPIHEFACIYTHDIKRKNQKRWQDGFLRFHTFNKRVMVYDIPRSFIGETFLKGQDALEDGDELTLDRGVMIQVCEPKGTVAQVREEILDKVAARAGRTECGHPNLNITPSSHAPRTPQNKKRSPTTDRMMAPSNSSDLSAHSPLAQLRPKPLNAILGTGRGFLGRASLPKQSPYQEKHGDLEEYNRLAKRQRISDREEMTVPPIVSTTAKRHPESDNTARQRQAPETRKVVAKPDEPLASITKSRLSNATQHSVGMIPVGSFSTIRGPLSPTLPAESWRSAGERVVKSPVIDLTGTNSNPSRFEGHLKKADASNQEKTGNLQDQALAKLSELQTSRKVRQSAFTDKPISKLRSAVVKRKPLMYQSLVKERRQVNIEQRGRRSSSLSSDTVTSKDETPDIGEYSFEDVPLTETVSDSGTITADRADVRPTTTRDSQMSQSRDEVTRKPSVEPIGGGNKVAEDEYSRHSSIESDGFESWDEIMKNKTKRIRPLQEIFVEKTPPKAVAKSETFSPATIQKALSPPSICTTTLEVVQTPHKNGKDQSERSIMEIHLKPTVHERQPDPELGAIVDDEITLDVVALRDQDPPVVPQVVGEKPSPVISRHMPVISRNFPLRRPLEQTDSPGLTAPTKSFVSPMRRRTSPLKKSLTDTTTRLPQPPIAGLQRSNTGDFATKSAPISLPPPPKSTDSDMGPWSKFAYDLFGFEGGEGWSINESSSKVDVATEPLELVERQKELVRKAKKRCRGMGGSTKSNIIYDDEYDYVESTYS